MMPKVRSTVSRVMREDEYPQLGQLVYTKQMGVVVISKVLIDRLLWYEDGFNSFSVDSQNLPQFIKLIIDEGNSCEILKTDQVLGSLQCENVSHMKFTKIYRGGDTLNIRTRKRDLGDNFFGDLNEGSSSSFTASVIVSTSEKSKRNLVTSVNTKSLFEICASHEEVKGEPEKF